MSSFAQQSPVLARLEDAMNRGCADGAKDGAKTAADFHKMTARIIEETHPNSGKRNFALKALQNKISEIDDMLFERKKKLIEGKREDLSKMNLSESAIFKEMSIIDIYFYRYNTAFGYAPILGVNEGVDNEPLKSEIRYRRLLENYCLDAFKK